VYHFIIAINISATLLYRHQCWRWRVLRHRFKISGMC